MIGSSEAGLKPAEISTNDLNSSIDQQRADQQLLQEAGLDLATKPLSTNGQASSSQLADALPTSQGPGQQSGSKGQQSEQTRQDHPQFTQHG